VAFARRKGKQWAVVVAPRLLTSIVGADELPIGQEVWRETKVELPDGAPGAWQNVFTDEVIKAEGKISIAEAMARFPVGLLLRN
jgi:(1->4)-alpha-D-glucan 1-alpha-D-glucosylmutase